MQQPAPHYLAKTGFGGLDLDLVCGDQSLATMQISDEDLSGVVKRGLERLSGQGKIDEELRSMCHEVGELPR